MALPCKLLIVGATGTIGEIITGAILEAQPRVASQISIFTSPATASNPAKEALLSSWRSQGVSVVTGDVNDPGDISQAYEGCDTVVSCLGRGSLVSQIELARLAEETPSVKWFFPSEYGTDIEYDASSRDEKPHQNKLQVRAFIRDNVKRVKCTYLVTGPWIDFFFEPSPAAKEIGGFDVAAQKAVVVGRGDDRIGFTSMPDVGKLMVAALRHPDQAMGQILKVQSFVTTPNEILKEFEKQTGEKWAVEHTSNQELRETEKKLWDAGIPAATGATLRRIWAEGGTLYEKTDNDRIGLTSQDMETLSSAVKRYIDESNKSRV